MKAVKGKVKFNFKDRRMLKILLIIFGAYTTLLLGNLPSFIYFTAQHPDPDWWTLTLTLVWGTYSWVLVTPLILLAGYQFRIARENLLRNVGIHLLVSVSTGILRVVIYQFGLLILGISNLEAFQFQLVKPATLLTAITGAIITYPTALAIQQAYLYFRESQERAFNLQQAELQMLKMQLQPHFFFNTLNAISALMYRSPREADIMIVQLGDMFRTALKKDKTQEITLTEELDFLKSFLQIHQTLMGKRLKIKWEIEPETLNALVPNLILQPLAENAIQHGVARLNKGGQITISAARHQGKLLLQFVNDGSYLALENGKSNGIGLSNTQRRLKNLYNENHKFSIDGSRDGVVRLKIELPFREQIIEKNEY